MTVSESLETFAGKPVEDYDPSNGIQRPREVAYRARIDYDAFENGTEIEALLEQLAADAHAPELEALVIGAWDYESSTDASGIVAQLVKLASRFTSLQALFIGDITFEEQEISWIRQSDVSPVLAAYPNLQVLRVRGGQDLRLSGLAHGTLRELGIEAGGLSEDLLADVGNARLPALERLELWLGVEEYGYAGSIDALAPLLAGKAFPALRHLGLMNAEDEDDVAARVAASPLLARLSVLDLSMGTLGDDGARALLAAPALQSLDKLVIDHHYLSPELIEALEALPIETEISEPEDDGEDRYVAVSE